MPSNCALLFAYTEKLKNIFVFAGRRSRNALTICPAAVILCSE
ncbi:hypothetical protein [Oscillospiraceae bacterium]|nr:hypothetical protein [Oscillospiraceae bacterium]